MEYIFAKFYEKVPFVHDTINRRYRKRLKNTSINELQGSKYLQSSNFNQIIKKVQDADKNIILFGTPCQIAGIKKIFGDKKDIIYVDLMCNIFLARILYAKDFFDAWKFVPVLLTGTVFNGIALFEGCIFTAVKKTREVSNTTLVGAAINTVLNLLLIPFIGALGAAIATMVGCS